LFPRRRYSLFLRMLLGVLALFLMGATGWRRDSLGFLEIAFREGLAPVQKVVATVGSRAYGWIEGLKSWRGLQEENRALKRKLERLQALNIQLEEHRLENQRLKELLHFAETQGSDFRFVAARVIGRNPTNWYSTLTLDKGERQGIKRGQVVITSKGLVGRVVKVSPNTAEVLLITDRECAVGGLILENRTPGVVEGSPEFKGYLQMIHISKEAPVEENQRVITSGLGGVFPKGIPIGVTVRIVTEPDGLMKKAIIAPFVDFDRLEEVLVII